METNVSDNISVAYDIFITAYLQFKCIRLSSSPEFFQLNTSGKVLGEATSFCFISLSYNVMQITSGYGEVESDPTSFFGRDNFKIRRESYWVASSRDYVREFV